MPVSPGRTAPARAASVPLPVPAQQLGRSVPPPPWWTPSPRTASSPARAGCRSPSPTARRCRTCDSPARVSLRTRSTGAFPSGSPKPLSRHQGSDTAQPQRASYRAGVSGAQAGTAPCPTCPLTLSSARGSLSPWQRETPRASPPPLPQHGSAPAPLPLWGGRGSLSPFSNQGR